MLQHRRHEVGRRGIRRLGRGVEGFADARADRAVAQQRAAERTSLRRCGGACRRAKVTNMRWHDLRHTFASWYVQRGGDLYRLSRILGHSGLQMTARYGHLRVEDLHEEIGRVAQYRPQERLIRSSEKAEKDHPPEAQERRNP
uniref:tyrosine-type recombinase/integrase n=1 Tax=Methylobacterium radiotolerans TaxID=31998 RepID=UPI002F3600A2